MGGPIKTSQPDRLMSMVGVIATRTNVRKSNVNITLMINQHEVHAELYDHPVARELLELLPLELVFNDFNGVEKVAVLDQPLTLAGVPDADAPSPGELGYHAPSRGLVLYYGNPGKWPGLVRMGGFNFDLAALRALPDGLRVRIAATGH